MKISVKTLYNITVSEFLKIFKDSGARLIMVIGAILYSVVYGIIYYPQVVRDVPVAIVDMDKSTYSAQFIRAIDATEQIQVSYRTDSIEEAEHKYFSEDIKAYIVIPHDFEKDILSGKQANVLLYADSAYLIVYRSVYTGVYSAVATLSAKFAIGKSAMKSGDLKSAIAIQSPVDYIQVPLYNSVSGYENYVFPAILILILQQTMLIGVGMLSGRRREKEKLYSEYSDNPLEIVLGRSVAYVSLYSIYGIMYFFIFPVVYSYNYYLNPILSIFVLLIYLFAVSFLAQTLTIFFREKEDSLIALVMGSISLIFLAGVVWPKQDIPFWLKIFADLLPSTHGIDAFIRINQMGANLSQVSITVLWLCLLMILYFITSLFVVKYLVKEKQQ